MLLSLETEGGADGPGTGIVGGGGTRGICGRCGYTVLKVFLGSKVLCVLF